jgi:hypothetical protein
MTPLLKGVCIGMKQGENACCCTSVRIVSQCMGQQTLLFHVLEDLIEGLHIGNLEGLEEAPNKVSGVLLKGFRQMIVARARQMA